MKEVRFRCSALSLVIIFCIAVAGAWIVAIFRTLWLESLVSVFVVSCLILIVNHDHPLRFFLKYLNPSVALVVLAICVFASSTNYDNDGR